VEVWAKVGELDRANLIEGQDAVLQLDSVPDKRFHGKVKALSGTATADVFSGDPSKKFDVVFSVDMRGLLTGLGMKAGDVDSVMATAESNARKNVTAGSPFATFQFAPGTAPGSPTAPMGAPGMGQGAGAMPPGAAVAGGRAPTGATPPGAIQPGAGAPGGRAPAAGARGGAMPGGAMPGGMRGAMPGAALGATPGGAAPAGASAADLMAMMAIGGSQFSDEDRKNAKVPLPPEADSQLQMLLRPGLLADVEITVENLPNVVHVPAQAVFQKDGQNIVYVQLKNGRFEPRKVKLVKQSESVMVLGGGVEPGELVALGDPMADKNAKKKEEKKQSSSNPMSSMPGGSK